MKVFFQIALLSSAIALASEIEIQDEEAEAAVSDREFVAFAAAHSTRDIKDMDEMKKRKAQYGKAKLKVAQLNKNSKGVTYKLNNFAFLLDEEREALKTRFTPEDLGAGDEAEVSGDHQSEEQSKGED